MIHILGVELDVKFFDYADTELWVMLRENKWCVLTIAKVYHQEQPKWMYVNPGDNTQG